MTRRQSNRAFAIVALIADCWLGEAAHAQAKLEASYRISVGVLTIGSIMMSADLAGSEYKISANGRTRGLVSVLSRGQASYATHGRIAENRLVPESFSSSMTAGREMLQVVMRFNAGGVSEMTVTPRIGETVPLTEADRQGVVDPLTAMFISSSELNGTPAQAACNRTLPIFDGYQRYDLKLSFKRLDTVDIKEVHDGPVVVCGVVHEPIAGHLTLDAFIRFLSGREIEAVLAPLDGARFLVPVRVSIAGTLANLVIQANRLRSIH